MTEIKPIGAASTLTLIASTLSFEASMPAPRPRLAEGRAMAWRLHVTRTQGPGGEHNQGQRKNEGLE